MQPYVFMTQYRHLKSCVSSRLIKLHMASRMANMPSLFSFRAFSGSYICLIPYILEHLPLSLTTCRNFSYTTISSSKSSSCSFNCFTSLSKTWFKLHRKWKTREGRPYSLIYDKKIKSSMRSARLSLTNISL